MLIPLICTVVIYLLSHKYFKQFNLTAWIALLGALLISTIYFLITDDQFQNIPLKNNTSRIREVISHLVSSLPSALIGLFIVILIDKKIYGKEPRN